MPLITKTETGIGFLRERVLSVPKTISSVCVDARSSGETNKLLPGLLLGIITASGKLAQYTSGATAGAGTDTAYYILMQAVDTKGGNPLASAADVSADVLKIGAVRLGGLGGYDAAAKVDLAASIEILDD